jgi:predicted DNA-binding transcriptional regulator AlpA
MPLQIASLPKPLPSTVRTFKALLETDPTIAPAHRSLYFRFFRDGFVPDPKGFDPPPDAAPRVIRRKEAARRLACCVRVIDRLAQEGKLRRVRLPGRIRSAGFLESDINQLLAANGQ